MTLDWARLTLRLGRFEVLAFGGLVLVLAAAAFAAAARIDSLRPPANCFGVIDVYPPGCESALNTWYAASSGIPSLIAALLLFLSFAAGVFLGVPIVARELERGTTRLAWSLAPSRMRWFLARMVPMLIVLAVVTFTAGVALDRLVAAGAPDQDLANSFIAFGFRGVLIASRAVFIFAVGAVVGAVVGRALPAIILTAVIATIGLAGGERVHQEILQREAVAVPMDPNGNGGAGPGDMYIEQKFVLPDGTLVGWEYFNGSDQFDEFGNPKFPQVVLVVPGERYRFVEAREALALAGGSLVALLLAGFVVSRRRPG